MGKRPEVTGLSQTQEAWDSLAQDYITHAFERDPGFASAQGVHALDGQLPDLSRRGIETTLRGVKALRARAEAFQEDALDETRRLERATLIAQADAELFWAERADVYGREPLLYANALDPSRYIARPYAPLKARFSAAVRHLNGVPEVLSAMQANLVPPLSSTHVEVSSAVLSGLVTYLESDFAEAFATLDAPLREELARATQVAVSALRKALLFLEREQARATNNFALGPALFAEMLWATERVNTPLAQLWELGQQDLARNEAALHEACAAFAPGASLSECAARIRADKPSEGALEAARAQLVQLKAFVAQKRLATIPGQEDVHVEEAPPHQRWNQAFIDIPGPYDVGQPAIYYIAPPDAAWTPEEQAAYVPGRADLMFVSAHEVWPGHFLQFLHANRAARPFMRSFVGYAFAEGWAHYAEELVLEEGFSTDPKLRIGQLMNALLRNVRFVSALGLHTQGMRVEESQRLFEEVALQDRANAKQQAVRGTFDPGYLNYTLGKLMIRKLRADWTAARGGREAYRAFHDALLSRGGPPLPLVRRVMLGDDSAAL